MRHELVALTDEHDISDFSCGVDWLDRYLTNEASSAHASGATRTHVWLHEGTSAVCAYVTLMNVPISPSGLPKRVRGSFRESMPGYLIAKLALHQDLRRQGLGTDLLTDALTTIVRAADATGGRLIVVDAIHDAPRALYKRADFTPIEGSNRLWMKVSTARAALSPGLESGQIPIVPSAEGS